MVPPRSDRVSRAPPYSRTNRSTTRTGLSPTMAGRSSPFRFSSIGRWPGPISLATTHGVSVDVLSSGYLDVSVRRVCLAVLCIQTAIPSKLGGFPHSEIRGSTIARISPRLIAACYVLHRLSMPRHPPNALQRLIYSLQSEPARRPKPTARYSAKTPVPTRRARSATCVARYVRRVCVNLFTMSKNQTEPGGRKTPALRAAKQLRFALRPSCRHPFPHVVEVNGIEPSTSCLQSMRSPN